MEDPRQRKAIKYHFLKNYCALDLPLFHRGIPFLLNSLNPDLCSALTALILKVRLMLLFWKLMKFYVGLVIPRAIHPQGAKLAEIIIYNEYTNIKYRNTFS